MPDADRYPHRGLYPILDRETCDARSISGADLFARWLDRHEFTIVQLRYKNAPTRAWVEWAGPLVKQIQHAGKVAVINDRTDVALITGADGVHLGQDDLLVPDARRVLGPDALIGLSTHDLSEIRMAETLAPDYLGFGPIYPTGTKSDTHAVQGLQRLTEACRATRLPIVAIGGITLKSLDEVLEAGARGAAMIGALAE